MKTTVENVACAACGCICEDITAYIKDGVIAEVEDACPLCAERLTGQTSGEFESAQIAEATEILANSRSPLIYGLAGSTVEAQRAAVSLAEAVGGTLDLALPGFHRAALQAMQTVGVSTCTLGEVRRRADVVVFWGADPTSTHPTLLERSVRAKSRFIAGDRWVISVGSQQPRYQVDDHFDIAPANTLAGLTALRASVAGLEFSPLDSLSQELDRLAQRLQNAEYSVILFGPGIGGVAEIESLFRLVRQLNARSRCVAIGLGGTQCENVVTWQTGYPCCVNFALGYPRYDPLRFSANSLIERGEVDSVLLIGSEDIGELSAAAQARLADLPVIHVGFPKCQLSFEPTVHIVAARPGVHCGGTVFRMDGVPIRLRPVFDSPLPTTEAVLTALQQGVSASCV
jgi:formylmethanofuran dehydrogenase subunit B